MLKGYAWADIVGAAGYWGSIAQILGISAAWFAFVTERREARFRTFESLRDIIIGIESELALISLWASGGPTNLGYRQAPPEEYIKDPKTKEEWADPERIIYRFDYPTIKSITQSQHVRLLGPLIDGLVRLNYSIVRTFDFYEEYRKFVLARPTLTDQVVPKIHDVAVSFSGDEASFLSSVFSYNHRIHVQYIGGADSPDPTCLYRAFRTASLAVDEFKRNLRPEASPRWYAGGSLAAWLSVILAVALLYMWLA